MRPRSASRRPEFAARYVRYVANVELAGGFSEVSQKSGNPEIWISGHRQDFPQWGVYDSAAACFSTSRRATLLGASAKNRVRNSGPSGAEDFGGDSPEFRPAGELTIFHGGNSEIRKLGIRLFRLRFWRSRADVDSGPPPLAPEPEVPGFVSSGPRPVSEGSSGRSALKPEGVLVRENQLFFAPEPTTAGPGPGAGYPLKISRFPGAWVPRPSKRVCV